MRNRSLAATVATLALLATACTTVHDHHTAPRPHSRITALVHITEQTTLRQVDVPMRLCDRNRKTGRKSCRTVYTGKKTSKRVVTRHECWQVTLATGHSICTSSYRWYGLRIGDRW